MHLLHKVLQAECKSSKGVQAANSLLFAGIMAAAMLQRSTAPAANIGQVRDTQCGFVLQLSSCCSVHRLLVNAAPKACSGLLARLEQAV